MLMLWYEKGDEYVDVQEGDHGGGLHGGTVSETVDILNFQHRSAGASRKRRHAAFEPDVGLSHSTEQGSDELIYVQAGLAREIGEPCLERRVDSDAGCCRHSSFTPPVLQSSHKRCRSVPIL